MGWLEERLRDAGDFFFHGGLEDDIRDLGRSIDDGVHSIGRKIDDTVSGFLKAVEDDPLKAAASALAIYSGQWWALPTVNAVDALVAGADIEDAVKVAAKTAAVQYITQQVSGYVGNSEVVQNFGRDMSDFLSIEDPALLDDSWTEWTDYGDTFYPPEDIAAFANLGTNGLSNVAKTVIGTIANTTASGVRALLQGKDVPDALLQGVSNGAFRTLLSSNLAGEDLKNAPDFVKRAIATAGAAGVLGESMSGAAGGSLLNDAMSYVKDALSDKYNDLTKDVKLTFNNPFDMYGNTKTTVTTKADPMDQAKAAHDNLEKALSESRREYKRYEDAVTRGQQSREELEQSYKLLTDPTALVVARQNSDDPWFSARKNYSDAQIKEALLDRYKSAETNIQSSNQFIQEFEAKAWPVLSDKLEVARQKFSTAIGEASNVDAEMASTALSLMQTYDQVANTIAKATGVDVGKVDRMQVTNLMNEDKPLEAAYQYAVKTNPNFIADSIKQYESDVAAGKTPDYNAMNVLIRDLSRYDDVKRINPDFNADEYKKLNALDVSNPYEHYLTTGSDKRYAGSENEAAWRRSLETSRLLGQAADLVGVGINELSDDTRKALTDAINTKFSDPRDFKEMAETNLRNWDDVAGLKLAPARLATLKDGMAIIVEGAGAGAYAVATNRFVDGQEGRRPQNDIDEEISGANKSLQQQFGQSFANTYSVGTEDDVIEGRGRWVEMPMSTDVTKSRMVYLVSKTQDAENELANIPVDNIAQATALANAPTSYFGGSEELRNYFKELVDNFKTKVSPVGSEAINTATKMITEDVPVVLSGITSPTTAGNVLKAFGGVLQSFNGVVTLAGINPESTPVGKFAKEMVELGKATTPAEYRAAVDAMSANLQGAQGALGAAKAIWKNFTDYPTEFLAEIVGVELLQEAAPLLIGAGASTAVRGLALARGMGQKFAQELGAKAGLTAGAIADITESVGGTAASTFEEAYNLATKKLGMSEAEATKVALDMAAKTGAFSGLVTAGTLGMGGMAAEKAILGRVTSGETAKAFDTLMDRVKSGAVIGIKEGLSEGGEEGITGAYTESQMYKLDPTRDVSANIASNAILGAIAGGSIAGGAYGFASGRDVLSNAMMMNPQVQAIIQTSPNIASAQAQLSELGIDNDNVRNEILNTKFGDQVVTNYEAQRALERDTNFTPNAADIAQLAGQTSQADLASRALAYVDPRVVDESEVIQTLQALGYDNPTAEDISRFTGQRDETSTLAAARSEFDPQFVNEAEARSEFAKLGFDPNVGDIAQFTGRSDQSKLAGNIASYADINAVDAAEARQALIAAGIPEPTQQQINSLVGQYKEADLGTELAKSFVTNDAARQALVNAGITNPTAEQVAQFVGQYDPSTLTGKVSTYADPFVIDREEARQALIDAGIPNPTAAQITEVTKAGPESALPAQVQNVATRSIVEGVVGTPKALPTEEDAKTAQKMAVRLLPYDSAYDYNGDGRITSLDALAISKMANGIDPGYAPSAKFGEGKDWQQPTGLYKEIADVETGLRKEIKDAVAGIKFPEGITADDVTKAIGDYMTANPGLSITDVAAKIGEATQGLATSEGVKKDIGDALQGYATKKEIEDAIAGIQFPPGLTSEDVTKAITDYMAANPGLSLKDVSTAIDKATKDLPTSADVKKNIADALTGYATAKDIEGAEDRILKAVADVQAGNTERFGDIDDAIADLRDAGLTEDDIRRIVGTPSVADDPTTPDINEAAQASGLYRDIETAQANVAKAITDTETRLGKAIDDAKKEGLAGDAALQKAIDSVAAEQGKSKESLLAAIGKSETDLKADFKTQLATVTGAITDVESRLTKAISDASAAGLKSDEALQAAIDKVAKDLGTTKTDVLAALGKSEAALKTEFASQLGETTKALTGELGAVKKDLSDAIADAKAAGLKGDAALQAAIGVVAADLGTTKDTLLAAIGTSETNLKAEFATQLGLATEATQTAIQGAEDRVLAKMGEYEAAGITRDAALDKAIQDVSKQLGVARTELEKQIFGVSELVGRPGRAVTQADLDLARQMAQPDQQVDLGYDVNRDGRIDDADIKLLESMLTPQTGQPPPPPPGAGSIWAPSGIYAQLATLQQQSAQQAAAQLQATQTAQRQANFGQMLNLLSQQPDISGQKVTVKPPDPARIGYTYDWSSIFATPGQEKLFASPFAEGGQVDVDELINILRS
jgi:dihydrofolate reductase